MCLSGGSQEYNLEKILEIFNCYNQNLLYSRIMILTIFIAFLELYKNHKKYMIKAKIYRFKYRHKNKKKIQNFIFNYFYYF